jgi:hypothetical protein
MSDETERYIEAAAYENNTVFNVRNPKMEIIGTLRINYDFEPKENRSLAIEDAKVIERNIKNFHDCVMHPHRCPNCGGFK